jgi:hypothetical protein
VHECRNSGTGEGKHEEQRHAENVQSNVVFTPFSSGAMRSGVSAIQTRAHARA